MTESSKPVINPWIIAISVMLGTFMEVLDTTVVNVSLQHIAGSLSVTPEEATWVLTSYLVANAIVLPLTGWLANQFGRKKLLMLSVTGFTMASFLCGLAPTLKLLILFRIIQGLTGGCLQPLSQAVLLEAFAPEDRGKAMGFWGLGIVVAPILGPMLGGWLTDALRKWTPLSAVWVSILSMGGSLVMTVVVFSMHNLAAVMATAFIMGIFGHMIMSPVSGILYDVVPPETRSSATAADGLISSSFSALTFLAVGALSYFVGQRQGLAEGNLRVGFQGAVSVLLLAGLVVAVVMLRVAPRDMQSLRSHVAGQTVQMGEIVELQPLD